MNKHHSDKNVFLLGTGGSTDLINAVELASQYDNLIVNHCGEIIKVNFLPFKLSY
jgi:poly-D-alanine transfer protein DltD